MMRDIERKKMMLFVRDWENYSAPTVQAADPEERGKKKWI